MTIVKNYRLDGIDIGWEYPITGGRQTDHKRKSDKENFVLLLRQFRTYLNALRPERPPLLTIASTGYRNHLDDLEVKEMAKLLDWFNLMGYDFNEMQPGGTSHHSGLFAWPETAMLDADAIRFANSDAAVQWYLDHGVPPAKIVLGLPFYGRVWGNVPAQNHGMFEPYEARPSEDGVLSYREIAEMYLPNYTRYWDGQAKVPWLYNQRTKIAISYVFQKKLAGIMFLGPWSGR